MSDIHPILRDIEERYDDIVAQWTNGEITPEQGQAALESLHVLDANGAKWRIDPSSGEWQAWDGTQWRVQDTANYVEPTPAQVDDWSAPYDSGFWKDDGTQHAGDGLPENWGDNEGHTWVPPVAAAGIGGATAVSQPPYAEQPAAGSPYGTPTYKEPDPAGMLIAGDESYDDAVFAEGVHVQAEPGWDEWDDDENASSGIVGKAREFWANFPGGKWGRIGAIVVAGFVVAFLMVTVFGGGGRSCGDTGYVITDIEAGTPDAAAAQCVMGAKMMTAVEINDELGTITFAGDEIVTKRDLSRSLGLSYVAIGGTPQSTPVPPDLDAIDESAAATRAAVTTAYAVGLVDSPVSSTDPVSVESALEGIAGLLRTTETYDPGVTDTEVLQSAGVIGDEEISTGGAATRIELAHWLSAVWESGATVMNDDAAGDVTTTVASAVAGGGSTTVPTTTVPTSSSVATTVPVTTVPPAGDLPSGDRIAELVTAVMSGDRVSAASAIANPGNAATVALHTAELGGMRVSGMITSMTSAPEAGEEGKVFTILSAVDAGNDNALIATVRVEMVLKDGVWLFKGWPNFKPVEA